jgi:hypothetical protein
MLFRNKFRPIKFNASFIALGLISFARANVICEHFLTGAANDNRQLFFHASNRSKYSKDRFLDHLSLPPFTIFPIVFFEFVSKEIDDVVCKQMSVFSLWRVARGVSRLCKY